MARWVKAGSGSHIALYKQSSAPDSYSGCTVGDLWYDQTGTAVKRCSSVSPVTWVTIEGGEGGAPTDATYIVQTANGSLTNEQALSSLATGIVKNTTGTGVLSIATAGTDYANASHTHVIANVTDAGALASKATVATADIDNDAVTYAKIQNISATDRILGRDTAAAGNIEELTVGGGIEFTGTGGLQRSALTGDVTADAGSNSTVIANDSITYSKIQNISATDKLLGRVSVGAGDIEEIACTAAGRALLDDADASAQRITLGLGSISTQASSAVSITGGSIAGITDITLADGGTNASLTASNGGVIYSTDSAMAVLNGTATAQKLLMSQSSTAPIWSTPTFPNSATTAGQILKADGTNFVTADNVAVFNFIIDGGGIVITTGQKGHLEIPFNCTITGWTILAEQSGSIVIDIWKDTYASFPPTVADTITGTEKPTLSSAQKNQDLSLSSWTTSVTAGDILAFNVDSITTLTRVVVSLRVTKT